MSDVTLTILDAVLIVVVLLSALVALSRGFVREFFGIFSWIIAFFCTIYAQKYLFPFWKDLLENSLITHIISLVTIFVGVLVVCNVVINKIAASVQKDGSLNAIDSFLGFLFGVARGVFIMSMVYIIFASFNQEQELDENGEPIEQIIVEPKWISDSQSRDLLLATSKVIISLLPEPMRQSITRATNVEPSPQIKLNISGDGIGRATVGEEIIEEDDEQ